jgi:hypothetical protein
MCDWIRTICFCGRPTLPLNQWFLAIHETPRPREKNVRLLSVFPWCINPASTEKFFSEFWPNFSVCFSLRPLDMRSERKIFFVNTGSMIFRCDPICPFSTYRGTCHQLFYFCDFLLIFLLSVQINI